MSPQMDFFFNFGSTYSYLAIMRLQEEAARVGVRVRWRPFNVRQLFVEQSNIPFPKEKAAKVRYMWRDIERRAARFGLPWNGVPPYPVDKAGLANRVGVIAGSLSLRDHAERNLGFNQVMSAEYPHLTVLPTLQAALPLAGAHRGRDSWMAVARPAAAR